jgi:hypothetical protein
MGDPLEVRLGSQVSGVSGSFGKCGRAWIVRRPPGPVPHSERLYSGSSRSADICDAQWPPMVYSSPAVTNGVVYVGSNDGNLYALYASTGAKLWATPPAM